MLLRIVYSYNVLSTRSNTHTTASTSPLPQALPHPRGQRSGVVLHQNSDDLFTEGTFTTAGSSSGRNCTGGRATWSSVLLGAREWMRKNKNKNSDDLVVTKASLTNCRTCRPYNPMSGGRARGFDLSGLW